MFLLSIALFPLSEYIINIYISRYRHTHRDERGQAGEVASSAGKKKKTVADRLACFPSIDLPLCVDRPSSFRRSTTPVVPKAPRPELEEQSGRCTGVPACIHPTLCVPL